MLTAQEIEEKAVPEIIALLGDTRRALFELLNEAQRSKKLEKPHLKREKRKEIARLLTILRRKQTAAEVE